MLKLRYFNKIPDADRQMEISSHQQTNIFYQKCLVVHAKFQENLLHLTTAQKNPANVVKIMLKSELLYNLYLEDKL